ncbi:MAG: hypothetical protein ACI8UO_005938 [Verrucomicrobiales bacterium]|jgi:uncharacterized protein (TIGR02284 family)
MNSELEIEKGPDEIAVEQLEILKQALDNSRYEYAAALEGIHDEKLEPIVERAVERREKFSRELTNALRSYGAVGLDQPEHFPNAASWWHSFWTELRATFAGNPARILFRDFEHLDEDLLGAYHRMLEHMDLLPMSIATLVQRQHSQIAAELGRLLKTEPTSFHWNHDSEQSA